jgi:hypothetical protein
MNFLSQMWYGLLPYVSTYLPKYLFTYLLPITCLPTYLSTYTFSPTYLITYIFSLLYNLLTYPLT